MPNNAKAKKKSKPEKLLEEIDEALKNPKLSESDRQAYEDLRNIIKSAIDSGELKAKSFSLKLALMYVFKSIAVAMISLLFLGMMIGFTFNNLVITNYLYLIPIGLIYALSFLISMNFDAKRLMYDPIYLALKIGACILKIVTFTIVNMLFFRVYENTLILLFTVVVSDILTAYTSYKLFR